MRAHHLPIYPFPYFDVTVVAVAVAVAAAEHPLIHIFFPLFLNTSVEGNDAIS